MNVLEKHTLLTVAPKLKCEFLAISPQGCKHCVHKNHINWKMRDGCKSDLCPIAKEITRGNR